MARDLTMLPVAAVTKRANVPYVLQTHGMVAPDKRAMVHVVDAIATRRALRSAAAIASLSDHEDSELRLVGGRDIPIRRLQNGIDVHKEIRSDPRSASGEPLEVLYLARLHERKRPQLFLRAALEIVQEVDGVQFSIAGPDGGELVHLQKLLANATPVARARIRLEGPTSPERVLERMAACDIYVLPTVNEFFGLTAVEAMLQRRPIIVDRTCGLAPLVESEQAGLVFDGTLESLIQRIRTLLANESLRTRMGRNGSRLVHRDYSIESVARSLENLYRIATPEYVHFGDAEQQH